MVEKISGLTKNFVFMLDTQLNETFSRISAQDPNDYEIDIMNDATVIFEIMSNDSKYDLFEYEFSDFQQQENIALILLEVMQQQSCWNIDRICLIDIQLQQMQLYLQKMLE